MKIAYVCYWDARRRDGVGDKITAQLGAWAAAGHAPTLFLLSPAPEAGESLVLAADAFVYHKALERPLATRRLYTAVRAAKPDLIYLRYDLFVPPPSALTRIAPTVVEVNSNLRAELAARSRAAALYDRLQEPMLLRRAAGVVCVSNELARTVSARVPKLPVKVIGNAIDLAGLPELPAPSTEGVRVAYLGDDQYWQGVDKLYALADLLPEWQFDLIGVATEGSRGNVTCHGHLSRAEYEPILARADLAVGTLALHRKLMDETSALKVPRYLAYGLPVLLGYEDTNFVGLDRWYLLRLPNTESNVRDNLDRIRAFAAAVKGRRVDRAEIAARFSTQVKEAARLSFLAEFARRA